MSGSWVETSVPCMLYCGDDLCNCSARWLYEELEDDDEDYWEEGKSLTAGKRALRLNQAYDKYLTRVRDYNSKEHQEVGVASSKATCTFRGRETGSASRLNTTLSLP